MCMKFSMIKVFLWRLPNSFKRRRKSVPINQNKTHRNELECNLTMKLSVFAQSLPFHSPAGGGHTHHVAPEPQQACHPVLPNTLLLCSRSCSPQSTSTKFPQPYKHLSLTTTHPENMWGFFSPGTKDVRDNTDFKHHSLSLARVF